MNPTKFKLGDFVWYICNNKIQHERVLAIKCIERVNDNQQERPDGIGKTGTSYETIHHVVPETHVFSEKEGLLASL